MTPCASRVWHLFLMSEIYAISDFPLNDYMSEKNQQKWFSFATLKCSNFIEK